MDPQIIEQVKVEVAKSLQVDLDKIDSHKPLVGQGIKIDQLDVVEIVMALEEAFEIEIPDSAIGEKPSEIAKSLSIQQLANIVSEQLKAKR